AFHVTGVQTCALPILTPRVALVSHSSFGGSDDPSAVKMREALQLIEDRDPSLQVEGEMQADAAISPLIRERVFPNARFKETANQIGRASWREARHIHE